jgi:hypothetical protein
MGNVYHKNVMNVVRHVLMEKSNIESISKIIEESTFIKVL